MAPARKNSVGYNGASRRPFDNYRMEFGHAGRMYWLGTFTSADIAARALADAELVGPPVTIESSPIEAARMVIDERNNICESDDPVFSRSHPVYVQDEWGFYWKKEAEKRENDTEPGPSSSQSKKKKNGGGDKVSGSGRQYRHRKIVVQTAMAVLLLSLLVKCLASVNLRIPKPDPNRLAVDDPTTSPAGEQEEPVRGSTRRQPRISFAQRAGDEGPKQ
ncbi:hypothetical protein TRIUR3_29823 [Triticum urartu]|uniref:Uncharacterized protein n=1 Tax=Triticum urartu TaxID=4572 RepID=M7YRJ4_TRIUA|nr:hypothetical protein TRIUR3_29823 [Triticum urartu]